MPSDAHKSTDAAFQEWNKDSNGPILPPILGAEPLKPG